MSDANPPTADTIPRQPDLTGQSLGDYQLLRRLGTGGMGQVYLARQLSLKRLVAVKLLRNDLATDPKALLRFQSEAEAVARLNHPNIVHIHQIGVQDGIRYMVLEYVEGRNLREYLARKGPPDLPVTLSILRQVALALEKAHEQGIVHRDIKPENILVTRRVEVKVTDFGLSRFYSGQPQPTHLTQSGVTVGTPLYMSPEQVQGHPLDHRSDIYSLGVTCFHLLAGEPPFRGKTAFEVALKHVQEPPPSLAALRPDLPPELCAMVARMMAKNPSDRYQTVRELLRDLSRVREALASGPRALGPHPAVALPPSSGSSSVGGDAAGAAVAGADQAPPAAPGGAWWRVGLLCLVAALGGSVYAWFDVGHRDEPVGQPPQHEPVIVEGLPEVRSPEPIVLTRERELLAVLANRASQSEDLIRATIELGLLYVSLGRYAEARSRFERLEREEFGRTSPQLARTVVMAARLGQAVVLAYREPDKDSRETHQSLAQASNDLIVRVASEPYPKFLKFEKDRGYQSVVALLLRYPELGQAVAEAINRNMLTLGKTPPLTPAILENLRNPPKGVK